MSELPLSSLNNLAPDVTDAEAECGYTAFRSAPPHDEQAAEDSLQDFMATRPSGGTFYDDGKPYHFDRSGRRRDGECWQPDEEEIQRDEIANGPVREYLE